MLPAEAHFVALLPLFYVILADPLRQVILICSRDHVDTFWEALLLHHAHESIVRCTVRCRLRGCTTLVVVIHVILFRPLLQQKIELVLSFFAFLDTLHQRIRDRQLKSNQRHLSCNIDELRKSLMCYRRAQLLESHEAHRTHGSLREPRDKGEVKKLKFKSLERKASSTEHDEVTFPLPTLRIVVATFKTG